MALAMPHSLVVVNISVNILLVWGRFLTYSRVAPTLSFVMVVSASQNSNKQEGALIRRCTFSLPRFEASDPCRRGKINIDPDRSGHNAVKKSSFSTYMEGT